MFSRDKGQTWEDPGAAAPETGETTVTCPTLLRCRPAAADLLGDLAARVRGDDGIAQFARFVLVGAATTAVYAALYISLSGLGYLPAHLVSTSLTTLLANEMHRRVSFRAEDRVDWFTAQWEAGGVAVVGLVATSAALGWLDSAAGDAPLALQIALVASVTATIGGLRFVALRWIFRPQVPARA
jgi:putative flippase GtrA